MSAYVAPPAQGPPLPMSWAASPSPHGSFFSSPFGFYPPFIAASPFKTPRATMPTGSELNNEVDFDAVFSNYRNHSPLRIRRDILKECWRKACSHSNFGVLLVKKAYREQATSTFTSSLLFEGFSLLAVYTASVQPTRSMGLISALLAVVCHQLIPCSSR